MDRVGRDDGVNPFVGEAIGNATGPVVQSLVQPPRVLGAEKVEGPVVDADIA